MSADVEPMSDPFRNEQKKSDPMSARCRPKVGMSVIVRLLILYHTLPPPPRSESMALAEAIPGWYPIPIALFWTVFTPFCTILALLSIIFASFCTVSDRSESFSDRFERRTLRKVRENSRKLATNARKFRENSRIACLHSNPNSS